uniref:Tetraspanin n=1 Tax=Macrostomum lignano TaxID=282301 RepID=A0A1I8H6E5_9PLAT
MAKACFHCMRILVILFNLIFVLVGCAILGIAIFLYVDKTFKGIKDNMEESKIVLDIILFSAIGVGGITIIVSTFGCCGAYHESECLLGTYFLCLFIIVATEVAAGVLIFVKSDKDVFREAINKSLLSSVESYMKDAGDAAPPQHLRSIQSYMKCCGANSVFDYASRMELGCTDKIMTFLSNNKLWVLITVVIVAAFELLTLIVAMSLCCTVRRMESGYIGVST